MNNQMGESNFDIKYFDKRVPDEDCPIDVSEEKQESYERLDGFFERIFDENSLNVAKVYYFIIFKQSSKEERDKKALNESSYVYGEIVKNLF